MSILIKGMEMPKNRPEHTYMMVFPSGEVWEVRYDDNRIMKYGTAIEIPTPHGRLIDADAFTKDECNYCDGACEALPCDCLNCKSDCRCDFMKDIADAPTIIPAEEDEA